MKCVQFIQFPLIARLSLLLLPLLEIQGANLEGRLWRQWPHVIVRNVTLSSNLMSCLFVCCRTVIKGWLPCVWNHWLIQSKSESNWSPSETIISLMTNIIPLRCSSFYFGRHCFYQYGSYIQTVKDIKSCQTKMLLHGMVQCPFSQKCNFAFAK